MSKQKEIVLRTITDIEANMDLFYQQKIKEALDQFAIVLQEITRCVDELARYREEHPEFVLDEGKIKTMLDDAMGALQEYDMVMLADVLQYDFSEYLKELADNME